MTAHAADPADITAASLMLWLLFAGLGLLISAAIHAAIAFATGDVKRADHAARRIAGLDDQSPPTD